MRCLNVFILICISFISINCEIDSKINYDSNYEKNTYFQSHYKIKPASDCINGSIKTIISGYGCHKCTCTNGFLVCKPQTCRFSKREAIIAKYREKRDVPIAADLKNTPCAPNDYFKIDCNTCYCNIEKTGYLCTENFCISHDNFNNTSSTSSSSFSSSSSNSDDIGTTLSPLQQLLLNRTTTTTITTTEKDNNLSRIPKNQQLDDGITSSTEISLTN